MRRMVLFFLLAFSVSGCIGHITIGYENREGYLEYESCSDLRRQLERADSFSDAQRIGYVYLNECVSDMPFELMREHEKRRVEDFKVRAWRRQIAREAIEKQKLEEIKKKEAERKENESKG